MQFFLSFCKMYFVIRQLLLGWDGDISWTMSSRGHFFSKWATSRGHCQRVTSRGHFLVTSRGRFCPREVLFLGEFSWTLLVTSRGHFWLIETNTVQCQVRLG